LLLQRGLRFGGGELQHTNHAAEVRRGLCLIRRKVGFQRFEQGCFASKNALLRKPSERLPEQRLSPFAIVNSIRLPAFVARDLIFRFRNGRLIERLADFSAAPPLRLLAIARISDEMFQRAEEKGTEASLLAISPEVGAIAN